MYTYSVGRRPQIDRSVILRTSLALADERGLAAVTMQAVAARLGVTPMALYRHVGAKANLLDGVVESLLDELPVIRAERWERQLAAMGQGLRQIARRHPAVFPLLLQRPATTPGARVTRERVYAVLRAAGIAPRHVERVERLITTLALGFAAGEATGRFRGSRAALDREYRALVTFVLAGMAPFAVSRASGRRGA